MVTRRRPIKSGWNFVFALVLSAIIAGPGQGQGLVGDPISHMDMYNKPVGKKIRNVLYTGKLLGLTPAQASTLVASFSGDSDLKYYLSIHGKCGSIVGTAFIANAGFWQKWPIADFWLDRNGRIDAYNIYLSCEFMDIKATHSGWICSPLQAGEFVLFGPLRVGEENQASRILKLYLGLDADLDNAWRHVFLSSQEWLCFFRGNRGPV